jgi:hypothetical protein
MVRDMLSTREDVFSEYTVENFERALTTWFTVDEKVALGPSDRVLYLLTTR